MTWEKEKAYRARRAEQLKANMLAAIEAGDREAFASAYSTALNYASKKELSPYYRKYLDSRRAIACGQ